MSRDASAPELTGAAAGGTDLENVTQTIKQDVTEDKEADEVAQTRSQIELTKQKIEDDE